MDSNASGGIDFAEFQKGMLECWGVKFSAKVIAKSYSQRTHSVVREHIVFYKQSGVRRFLERQVLPKVISKYVNKKSSCFRWLTACVL